MDILSFLSILFFTEYKFFVFIYIYVHNKS